MISLSTKNLSMSTLKWELEETKIPTLFLSDRWVKGWVKVHTSFFRHLTTTTLGGGLQSCCPTPYLNAANIFISHLVQSWSAITPCALVPPGFDWSTFSFWGHLLLISFMSRIEDTVHTVNFSFWQQWWHFFPPLIRINMYIHDYDINSFQFDDVNTDGFIFFLSILEVVLLSD